MVKSLKNLAAKGILHIARLWLGFNMFFTSPLLALGERYFRVAAIVAITAIVSVLLFHPQAPPWTKILVGQYGAAVVYLKLLHRFSTTKMFYIIPSSLPTALFVCAVLGGNIATQLQEQLSGGKVTMKDLRAPVFEIHLKKRATPAREEMEKAVRELGERYQGVLFYTYSPLAVSGLLRKSGIKPALHLNSPTKINPKHARKYRQRNKPFRFYLVKTSQFEHPRS